MVVGGKTQTGPCQQPYYMKSVAPLLEEKEGSDL